MDRFNTPSIQLIYDRQCPLCDYYVRILRIQESVGVLALVDARESTEFLSEVTAAGLDIDQGMVLKMNDQLYHGSDAIHMLSLLSTRSGSLNRIFFWIFRSRRLSVVLYPICRFFRNRLLKARGVKKINNLNFDGNNRF